MPKSKRNKEATLSTTVSKGRQGKSELIANVRQCLDNYKYLYVFTIHNSRNNLLKEVRSQWAGSRFFLGKNKVLQKALGKTEEEEYKDKLHKVSEVLVGNCGLFFTNEPEDKVLEFFGNYSELDFARSGATSTKTIVLEKGALDKYFSHSMESYLRTQLHIPTSLKNGIVYLDQDYEVCKIGDILTPEQARILKLLDIKMAEFHFELLCVWSAGKFKKF